MAEHEEVRFGELDGGNKFVFPYSKDGVRIKLSSDILHYLDDCINYTAINYKRGGKPLNVGDNEIVIPVEFKDDSIVAKSE